MVKVAALDGTTSQSLMQKYGVQGFPTIKIFGADKKSPVDYQGERKADAIISHALKAVTQLVSDRKGGKGSSSSKSESKKSSSGSGSKKSEVIELTDTNFNALVMESKDQWLVEFFAPWCGHCKNLAPEWEEAAKQLKGSVKLGAVDATVHSELASKYGVKGYPTIKVFPAGKKGKATDYNGPRESTGIVEYAMKLLDESGVPPEITQLTSQGSFDESCGNNRLCAILFVPHILDSGASGRNAYISMMQEVSKEFRGKPVSFVWSEGGAQADLETGLGATFGYPALVFLAKHKGAYSIMRSSWSKQNIVTFINGVMRGRYARIIYSSILYHIYWIAYHMYLYLSM